MTTTIFAITDPGVQPSNGWGGPFALVLFALLLFAGYKAMPYLRRWTGMDSADAPSPTPPAQVGGRKVRQLGAGLGPGSDRPDRDREPGPPTLEPAPRSGLNRVWTALRTGADPGPDYDVEYDEEPEDDDEETVEEYCATLIEQGYSTSRIIRGAMTHYPVREKEAQAAFAYALTHILGRDTGGKPLQVSRPVEEVDVGLDDEEEGTLEECVAARVNAGPFAYNAFVRESAARFGVSESKVKREIEKARSARRPGQAA